MGLILLIIIWLITLVSTYFFVAKTWWLPVGASAAAPGIDHHFTVTFILMGVVFVAAQLALGYLVWLYRERGAASSKATYSHGNTRLEIVWTILTTVLFVGLNLSDPPQPIPCAWKLRGCNSRGISGIPGRTGSLAQRSRNSRMPQRAVKRLLDWIPKTRPRRTM